MQRGETSHGIAHHVRPLNTERVEHATDIVPRPLLGVTLYLAGDLGRRIAARVENDAPVSAREVAHLRLPAAEVAGEFMRKHDGRAGAGLLIVELHAIV